MVMGSKMTMKFFLVVLELDLTTLHLLGRCSAHFVLDIFLYGTGA
jgi:hypothetical protein